MIWSSDLWQDFTCWWGTIDWGDAPSWAAAILTSVSVFLAILILAIDKRRARRAEFMKVVPRHTQESEMDKTTLKVVVYNANEHPIPLVLLQAWTGLIYTKRVVHPNDSHFAIGPQKEGKAEIEMIQDFLDKNYYLEVVDSLGQHWYRGAKTNKPIRSWRVKLWRRRTPREALQHESKRQAAEKQSGEKKQE